VQLFLDDGRQEFVPIAQFRLENVPQTMNFRVLNLQRELRQVSGARPNVHTVLRLIELLGDRPAPPTDARAG
jgi:hypothetical protein